jgi:nitroimidazol reductase NimA-like FMN-containing flavoprotein (pyridoxamine 5'-phosphate oxidase superfamily)
MAIEINQSREHLSDFLSKHGVGVLATSTKEGKPYAATVYLTYDQQFNIYFVTKKDTQKSRNLQTNNQAAIAVYDAASQTTVQAEGAVVEVTDPEQVTWVTNDIWRIAMNISPTSPPPQTRLTAGGYIAYKLITPSLRMATFKQQDPADYDKIFEVVSTRPVL